jgi:hypothetical protein
VEAGAACVVGALIEGLVGPLSPSSKAVESDRESLVEAIVGFCLRALSVGSNDAPRPRRA